MGPYIIRDISLLKSLPGSDAVIPTVDKAGGVQCVGLLKYYSQCGSATLWNAGEKVMASKFLKSGTAIATFNSLGKYENHKHGNHACFFIGFVPGGIEVLEQHVKPNINKIQTRKILSKIDVKGVSPSDNPNAYSVVL